MKITLQKTMYLDEVPQEIDETFESIANRFLGAKQILSRAQQNASEGRYIDASEELEKLREVLSIIDKNLEEQQSICLSYEKVRIALQYPQESSNEE